MNAKLNAGTTNSPLRKSGAKEYKAGETLLGAKSVFANAAFSDAGVSDPNKHA